MDGTCTNCRCTLSSAMKRCSKEGCPGQNLLQLRGPARCSSATRGLAIAERQACRHTSLKLTTVSNHDIKAGVSRTAAAGLNGLDNIVAFNNLAKHTVLPIKPACSGGAQEELGSVGVWASIGHGQNSRTKMLEHKVLILKPVAVNAPATSPIVVGEIAALAHEIRDDPMEAGVLVAEAFLFRSTELQEVLGCLWNHILLELHDNSPKRGSIAITAKLHVEVHNWIFRIGRPQGGLVGRRRLCHLRDRLHALTLPHGLRF
mmetsp:Transcript_35346/g.100061  ORF Transcript_35346/g.100061 Transcript_35346/m.100061 type:complete len:260 (+) Transcript_35346:226-1005(+)